MMKKINPTRLIAMAILAFTLGLTAPIVAQEGGNDTAALDNASSAHQEQGQFTDIQFSPVVAPSTSISPVQANNQSNYQSITFNSPEETSSTVTSTSVIDSTGHGYRGFALPGDVYYPPLIGYTSQVPDFGPQCQIIQHILRLKNTFTVEELQRMLNKEKNGKKIYVRPLVEEAEEICDRIRVLLRTPNIPATVLGYITVAAKNTSSLSTDVMAQAAIEALKLGADAIQVTAEGTQRRLKSFGWGIGFNYSRATINSSEDQSGVGSGGLGISGSSAGYVNMPWMQILALKLG